MKWLKLETAQQAASYVIDELNGIDQELSEKSNEVAKNIQRYDFVVQVFQGEWFNIFCSGNYMEASEVMNKSEYDNVRIIQIY